MLAAPSAARADVIELRLDLIPGIESELEDLVASSRRDVLATCRRFCDGGLYEGLEADRAALLLRAANAGATLVDIEAGSELDAESFDGVAEVVHSVHVTRVPEDFEAVIPRLLSSDGLVKYVVHRGDERDALRVLRAVRMHAPRLAAHIVSHPFTRLAGAALGSPLVYAALRPGGRLGLPLPTVNQVIDRMEFRRATEGTPLFVLVGRDVSDSVSPDMLNAAFRAVGSQIVAARWSVDDPRHLLGALDEFGWAGMGVTNPHKATVHDALVAAEVRIGGHARAAGAVNTVRVRDAALEGLSTDGAGLLGALAGAGLPAPELDGKRALVLGAGGAARSAVVALNTSGARVSVFARRIAQAESLRTLGARTVHTSADDAVAAAPEIVVDATPAGPPGGTPFIDPSKLPGPATVLDMLVAAQDTALLAAAREAGHVVVPGFEMLVEQAMPQIGHLVGATMSPDAIARVGRRLLARRARNIVLVGLRCTGKTTTGRELAALLGREFVDTDALVTESTGRTPDDFIAAGQLDAFRAAEGDALHHAASLRGVVLATGGGAALHAAALRALGDDATVVLLHAADDELVARWQQTPRAPLSDRPSSEEVRVQRAERMPLYRALATLTVDVSDMNAVETAEWLADRLATADRGVGLG